MAFPSIVFLFFFLPVLLLIYYQVPVKWKNTVLFTASLIFYGWGEPLSIFLLLLNLIFNFYAGLKIEQQRTEKGRRIFFLTAIAADVLLWLLFQYGPRPADSVNRLFSLHSIYSPILPLGLTVCTMQGISYLANIYHQEARALSSFTIYGVYAALFVRLPAGPLVSFADARGELARRSIHQGRLSDGILRFTLGLGKKVLVGDPLCRMWMQVRNDSAPGAASAWLGLAVFMLWIYLDFSAYSDMAAGLGKMLGFTIPENFNYPYRACSLRNFWQRWNISLTHWIDRIICSPLRKGRHPAVRNCVLFILGGIFMGIWYGRGLPLILWGIYSALLLLGEVLLWGDLMKKLPRWLNWSAVMLMILLGMIFFMPVNTAEMAAYIGALFGRNGGGLAGAVYLFSSYWPIFLIGAVSTAGGFQFIGKKIQKWNPDIMKILSPVSVVIILILCTAYLVDGGAEPFWYIIR